LERRISNKKASIVIPVWNGREYLPTCISALLAQDYADLEVIAVDNASTDGSADWVAKTHPQICLVRNRRNLGFAGACNVGMKKAQGEILVLLNQDTRVRPGWLRALARALQNPQRGVVGCKIFYFGSSKIQHAGGWVEWPLALAHHTGVNELDEGQWDDSRKVDYVTGAAMAFRRDILDQVGFLDEEFWPGYFEDVDFCFRVRKMGYEVWYIADAVLEHHEGGSTSDLEVAFCANQRGRMRFLLKHMSPERFLAEFIPAERAYQTSAISDKESASLRLAYLEGISMAVSLIHRLWHTDEEMVSEVVRALQGLYQRAWGEDWRQAEERVGALTSALSSPAANSEFPSPSLHKFEFRSTVPVIGSLIARFRSFWYSVASRWAIHDLVRQQDALNQRLNLRQEEYVRALESQIGTLVKENAFLAGEIARLTSER